MFGKVVDVNKNLVKMINGTNVSQPSIMNYHVVFDEGDRKIIGEIVSCDDKFIEVNLVGEIRNSLFTSGVLKKPSFQKPCRIIAKSELELLIGKQNYLDSDTLLIGQSIVYPDFCVTADNNSFFFYAFCSIREYRIR